MYSEFCDYFAVMQGVVTSIPPIDIQDQGCFTVNQAIKMSAKSGYQAPLKSNFEQHNNLLSIYG